MRQEYFDNTPAPTFNATPVHTECQKCTTGTILYNYNGFSSAFLGFLHSIKGALTYGIQSSFSKWNFYHRHSTSSSLVYALPKEKTLLDRLLVALETFWQYFGAHIQTASVHSILRGHNINNHIPFQFQVSYVFLGFLLSIKETLS